MRKIITYPITAALLFLGGCSEVDQSSKAEESCDLCHATALSKSAVHRLHLTYPAMATFPFDDNTDAAKMKVVASDGDTTFEFKVDSAFKFSNSATLNRAAHYRQKGLLHAGIDCSDCHRGLDSRFTRNDDGSHRNGTRDASFDKEGLLAKHFQPNGVDTAHYLASAPAMTIAGNTCSNIACHGAGRKGVEGVKWMVSSSVNDTLSCMTCHNTKDHKVGVSCDKCHYDVTLDGSSIHNFRKHLNDTIEYGKY